MNSIRIFLVASILAALTLFNFIAALSGYQSGIEEAETLFDNELLDLARLVSNLDLTHVDGSLRLGNNMAFQVWLDDKLQAASFLAPEQPVAAFSPGFDYSNFGDYRWRTFVRREGDENKWVMVAERTDLRFVLAENVVLEAVKPILLSIPLIGLLVWLIVSHGLKPLNALSDELRFKRANDLTPLQFHDRRQELDQVVNSIDGFISRLSTALDHEKRFSADAAHELRTPISALKIQLHNLKQDVKPGNEAFRQLQDGVARMQHLVEQLLALYRMTPDQFATNCRQIDLCQLTQNVIARQYALVEEKSQTLEFDGDTAIIVGEEFALETLVSNLLSNAGKFTPEGGLILVSVRKEDDRVCLSVDDNGPGIDERDRERIFDRFYRGGSNTSQQVPGCGLGLTIVRHVADLHQAQLSLLDSCFSSGCSFRVSFPLERDNHG